jgi:hypothetical protein
VDAQPIKRVARVPSCIHNAPMKIEFRVEGSLPHEVAFESIRNIFEPRMQYMRVPAEDVTRVIIADEAHYGSVIKEVAPDGHFTNDGVFRGVGKAVPLFEAGAFKGSVIILHTHIIGTFLVDSETRPPGEIDAARHSVCHELGHWLDYRHRTEQHSQEPSKTDSYVKWCSEVYAPILISEYAAEYLSAQDVTETAFQYLCGQGCVSLIELLKGLEDKRTQYRISSEGLEALNEQVFGVFWRGLTEFAKMIALLSGNPSLQQAGGCKMLSPFKSDKAASILQSLAGELQAAWSTYPHCTEAFSKVIIPAFYALTEAEGYKYEIREGKDWLQLLPRSV